MRPDCPSPGPLPAAASPLPSRLSSWEMATMVKAAERDRAVRAGYALRKPFSAVVGSLVVGFQAPKP
jgi:hypothetical protein